MNSHYTDNSIEIDCTMILPIYMFPISFLFFKAKGTISVSLTFPHQIKAALSM